MKLRQLSKNGFTLVELTVVIMLMGIIGIILSRLMVFSASQNNRIKQEIEAQNAAQTTMSYVVSEVRRHDVSKSITFFDDGAIEVMQIYDPETPFKIQRIEYDYQWIWTVSETVEGRAVNRLHVKFGDAPSDYASGGTDTFLVSEEGLIQSITWNNIATQSDGSVDYVRAFDLIIRYYETDTRIQTIETTVYIRSDI